MYVLICALYLAYSALEECFVFLIVRCNNTKPLQNQNSAVIYYFIFNTSQTMLDYILLWSQEVILIPGFLRLSGNLTVQNILCFDIYMCGHLNHRGLVTFTPQT